MKILYTIHSLYNPGGMERVLLNKATWLAEHGYEVVVVTTDQHARPTFYPFPTAIRMLDLGVNYSDDNGKNFILKTIGFLWRRQLHKKRLAKIIELERPDIVDCLYPGECSFVPSLRDGSRKVMELHQSKLFHHQYNRSGLMGLADRHRAHTDEKLVRRFDRFVVLTEEDRKMWGEMPGIHVIPNAAMEMATRSDVSAKRIIAVGRLDYQKGFDRLIESWAIVQRTGKYADWHLDIFGQGEWREMLQGMIDHAGIGDTARLNEPTQAIGEEYARSSALVMSSNYEGLPMVMIEAMACGLPVVSFDFKCGPRDIIDHEVNGLLVPNDDIDALASAMMRMMDDGEMRCRMSAEALLITEKYSEERVMSQWTQLYYELTHEKTFAD